ncbi:MAG TPA: peptidylprolyl isomerase, partial [Cyclobacteriaceae bacterium]|nr:peptidylprolyl isomerase [Cyclobacteriaceae bacterium]
QVVNQIQDIYRKLLAGADWDELCSKYSDDANTKFNGGKFKAFGVGAFASVPEFETMAFSMYEPGTYSKPFTTAYGWHIIKLIDRISLPTYDQLAPTLRSRISRDERVAISKKQQTQKLLKQYSYTENEQVKNSMLLAADSSLNKASWRRQVVNSADYVATLADQKISLQDFYQYAEKNQQPNMMQPAAYMQQLYDGFLEKMVLDLEEQRLIRENKSFALLLKEYEEGLLLFDIMERMVWNRAVIDTTGLRAFHEVNRSNYNWNERVKASIFAHKDKNILQKIESIAANEKALMAYRDEHKISYVADAFEKGQSEVLDALTWTPGNYFYQLKDLHYYIQIHEILSPTEKSLEEARGELIADYQEYLENQWLNHLQQKYPLKLNEKVKKYVVSVLQQ